MTGTGGLMMNYRKVIDRLNDYIRWGISPVRVTDAKTAVSAIQELQKYKQLGTLGEVREAVEKQRAISREIIEGKYFCPKCHNLMPYPGYCGCGQKLY